MRFTRLVEYLHSVPAAGLPHGLLDHARIALLDNLGCGLFGAQREWGRIVTALVRDEASQGRASVYGSSTGCAPARAALANGTCTHGFELDDIILGALSHPGAVVVPVALAVAESAGASGTDLLRGIVAGYEVMARVGAALGHDHNNRGFHTTGIAGPVAAAVAAGIVLRLPVETILSAVGTACSSASGIKAFTQGTGGMVKRMHAGRAAESGVLACDLAARGFAGPLQAVDGRFGLLEVIGGEHVYPERIDADLGTDFAVSRVWIKAYACCGLIHSTMHALEQLKAVHAITPSSVRSVRVRTSKRAAEQNGDPDPQDTMTAQYSIPFCAGVALTADARSPEPFMPDHLWDERVRGIAARTQLDVDPAMDAHYPAHFGAHVAVELESGAKHERTVLDPHGTPADPFTPAEAEAKFRTLAGAAKDAHGIEAILAAVARLDASAASVAALSAALRA
ncbi:MAG: MmgE/PrpD family protein [Burkholderiales bacterium]|nr:MmgE/PrpD family protein [Burkholderiales bacterium]